MDCKKDRKLCHAYNEIANGCTRTLAHIQGLLGILSWLAPGNTDTHSNYAPSSVRYAKLLQKLPLCIYLHCMFTEEYVQV